ncbi:type 2 periplasmic-binding domain-containing protein [Salinimonas chungwhensis]|uniref:hypothetical protein n=1 Tax=Salinimonas chungwhensis TaxID=265425 RepID=UPI00036F665E|nr:hypothetical protein [Salinimonas chungwhensis]
MKLWCITLLVFVVNAATAKGRVSVEPSDAIAHRKLHIPAGVNTTDEIHSYIVGVLTRALELTEDEYGPVVLDMQREATVQTRQILNLEKGMADIIWMISDSNRDARVLSVPIPIIGGLYGVRVLMVRKSDTRFSQTRTLATLKKLSLTQGIGWPDTQILRSNGFNVTSNPYLAGFRAVSKNYVDAYPRALHEANLELDNDVTQGLMLDPHHLLFYPNPMFFYVDKKNIVLAKRIEYGLALMIESGELQSLLENTTFYVRAKKALAGRKVFELNNKQLSDSAVRAFNRYLEEKPLLEYARKSPRLKQSSTFN